MDDGIEVAVFLWSEPSTDLSDLIDLDAITAIAGDDFLNLFGLLLFFLSRSVSEIYSASIGDSLQLVTYRLVLSYKTIVCVVGRVVVFESRAMTSFVVACGRKVQNPTCLHICTDWYSAILNFYTTTFPIRPKLYSEPPDASCERIVSSIVKDIR